MENSTARKRIEEARAAHNSKAPGLRESLTALADEFDLRRQHWADKARLGELSRSAGAKREAEVWSMAASDLRALLDASDDAPGAEVERRTLGSLTADDIGSHVEFWDYYEGEPRFGILKSAHHHTASGSPSTWLRVHPFDGPFMSPSETPVQVTSTPHEDGAE